MKTHQDIDRRGLQLARAVAGRIDHDPCHKGLDHAREVCARWIKVAPSPAVSEWDELLQKSWPEVRRVLLMESEEGNRLRQNSPFCGILTPRERWSIFKKEMSRAEATA